MAKRVPVILEAISILKERVGDTLPVVAGMTGPFTLAGHLSGIEPLLKGLLRKPDKYMGFIQLAAEIGSIYGQALMEAGADVVSIADPSASSDMISPRMFRGIVKPAIAGMVEAIGGTSFLHICGNCTPILGDMAETGVDSISISDKVDARQAKELVSGNRGRAGGVQGGHRGRGGPPGPQLRHRPSDPQQKHQGLGRGREDPPVSPGRRVLNHSGPC